MSTFVTRVELHNANGEDYVRLHQAMAAQGFARTIMGSDGKRYHLPTAEYHFNGLASTDDVRNKASTAARTVKPSFAVVASEYNSCSWVGLPTA